MVTIQILLIVQTLFIAQTYAQLKAGTSVKCSLPNGGEIDPSTAVQNIPEEAKKCITCWCQDGKVECDFESPACREGYTTPRRVLKPISPTTPRPIPSTTQSTSSTHQTHSTTTTTTPKPRRFTVPLHPEWEGKHFDLFEDDLIERQMKAIGPDPKLKFRDEDLEDEMVITTTARPSRFRTSTTRATSRTTSTTTPKPQTHASRKHDKELSTHFKSSMPTDKFSDKQLFNNNLQDILEPESLPSLQKDEEDKVLLVLTQSEINKLILLLVTSICLTVVIMLLRYIWFCLNERMRSQREKHREKTMKNRMSRLDLGFDV